MARGSGSRDRTAPTVTITSPAVGTYYLAGQTVNITATASDNKGVARVEFSVLDTWTNVLTQLPNDNNAPYTASWVVPSNSLLAGQQKAYRITARAIDTSGNYAEHIISISTGLATTTSTTTTTTAPPVLPSSYTIPTPPAFNQRGEGSCEGQTAALILSIEKYHVDGATSYSQSTNILSPEWIYNMAKCCGGSCTSTDCIVSGLCSNSDCGNCGIGAGDVYVLNQYGIPRWSVCPYDSQNGCTISGFTQAMIDDANLIKSQIQVRRWVGIPTIDIYNIKRMLCNNHALRIRFNYDDTFYYADCNTIWTTRGTSFLGSGNLSASHAATIIGYDDAKQAVLLQNSWGTSWGCDGKIWIAYSLLPTLVNNLDGITTRTDLNLFNII